MNKLAALLPESTMYAIRRLRFKVTRREQDQKFSIMRRGFSADGYTLKPFDTYQCIFIHVPKCAGQSIRNTFFENLLPGHMQVYTYQLIYPKKIFDRYYKFTFVRNPWDRLVSAYTFLKAGGAHEKDRIWSEENLSNYAGFEEFVAKGLSRSDIQAWPHFRPQVKFLEGQNGKIELDFIGRFENIGEDFNHIRNHLGISSDLLYINKTNTKKQPYRTYYSEELKEIAAAVYHEDIDAFGYAF